MDRCEKAVEYFKEGYACSQALALSFSDLTSISFDDMKKLSLGLGAGLGRMRLTCGAISSISLIVGMLFYNESLSIEENKVMVYEIVRDIANRFMEKYGTINCKTLLENAGLEVQVGGKPEKRSIYYYEKRPCEKIVYYAAKMLEEYLIEKGRL